MASDIEINIQGLVDSGILQETNRQWFHPIGLALTVVSVDGEYRLTITQKLVDPEIRYFADGVLDRGKFEKFQEMKRKRYDARARKLGYVIQPEPPK